MLRGYQTWVFTNRPVIASTGTVAGPFEAQGPLVRDFDLLHGDLWLGQDSYEKAERKMLEEACEQVTPRRIQKEDVQFFLCGDLINQITPAVLPPVLLRFLSWAFSGPVQPAWNRSLWAPSLLTAAAPSG